MMASTSSQSATLMQQASTEGLKHLYRTLLCQARLLATTLRDPIVYSSHRYLARQNLEPFLLSAPTTASRRLTRAKEHRRHLADANFGWEHAVHRALSLAYGHSGKLRRDALSDLSPQRSSAEEEKRYPKELRKKVVGPVLSALLTSQASMDGAVVKSEKHLSDRPPPPYLPAEDDPLVKLYGKAMGRRRVINAAERFRKAYLRKVKVPVDVVVGGNGGELFRWLEQKARSVREGVVNYPKRLEASTGREEPDTANPAKRESKRTTTYLQAMQNVDSYRSDMHSSPHRQKNLRTQGWESHPKDFSRSRAQRRLYARILAESPLLILDTPSSPKSSQDTPVIVPEMEKVKKDPLTIRAKLRQAEQLLVSAGVQRIRVKIGRSKYAVGHAKGEVLSDPAALEEGEKGVREWFDTSEKEYLRQKGWL